MKTLTHATYAIVPRSRTVAIRILPTNFPTLEFRIVDAGGIDDAGGKIPSKNKRGVGNRRTPGQIVEFNKRLAGQIKRRAGLPPKVYLEKNPAGTM